MARAVVIGTGAGGMAAAAYLAQAGIEVVALEQGEHFGGYCNPFSREGFQFDPGIHYVGECRAGGSIHATLGGIGLDADALFVELDPDGFDIYRFPDFEMRVCRGLDAYRERLITAFPDQARGLERFFRLVESSRVVMRALFSMQLGQLSVEQLRALPHLPAVLRWATRSYGALLRSLFKDARLRAVLAAASGDYGLPPGRLAAPAGLLLIAHYADGAYFPRGGSRGFRDALVGAAERQGARFRARARVERILTRDGRVTGVRLQGGEELEADVVVSDVDPVVTFGQLLAPEAVPPALRQKVAKTEPSLGSLIVYLGMRRDLRAHGLGRFDVWQYPTWDIDALYEPLFTGAPLAPEPAVFLSPSSLKDDTGTQAPAGASTLMVMTMMSYARFERWRDRPVGARGPEYEAEKQRLADWLLGAVERRWPGLVGDVAVREVSTPLTNESDTLAVRGAAYGPALTPEQSFWRRFGPRTPMRNLFLAGAGVFGDGIAPCLGSGRIAARLAARAVEAETRSAAQRWRHAPA